MRDSCLRCARKHIAAAEVLMTEAELGYELFAWYAVGHLEQAESELLSDYPEEARIVRTERVKYIDGLDYGLDDNDRIILRVNYHIDTLELLRRITSIEIMMKATQPDLDQT